MLFVCRKAIVESIVRVWVQEQYEEWKADAESNRAAGVKPIVYNFDALVEWLGEDEGDKSFKTYVRFWVLETVPALSLLLKSQRQCDFVAFNAARKTTLPLLFCRGNLNYGPAVLEDLVVFTELAPQPILRQRALFFTYKGQGYDYKLEESNSNIKQAITQDTEKSFQFAAACRDAVQWGRKTLFREMGKQDRRDSKQALLSYTKDVENISKFLWNEKCFVKKPNTPGIFCHVTRV